MPEFSNYGMQAFADYFFHPAASAPVRPTSHKMSLWSAITDARAGAGTELTTGTAPGYVRATIIWGSITVPGGVMATSLTAVFPAATASWPAATHYGVHDHAGNLLQALKALTAAQTILIGDHGEVPAGSLIITLS